MSSIEVMNISDDPNEPPVRLEIEQLDESGFNWRVTDESDAEPIAQGYTRFQPMALTIGKTAAKLWIMRNKSEFDPAVANESDIGEMSYSAYNLVETVNEVCEQHNQAAPFWLGFVHDLDVRLDEIIELADQEDELEDMPDSDDDLDFDDDSDFTQEDAIDNYIGDRD